MGKTNKANNAVLVAKMDAAVTLASVTKNNNKPAVVEIHVNAIHANVQAKMELVVDLVVNAILEISNKLDVAVELTASVILANLINNVANDYIFFINNILNIHIAILYKTHI